MKPLPKVTQTNATVAFALFLSVHAAFTIVYQGFSHSIALYLMDIVVVRFFLPLGFLYLIGKLTDLTGSRRVWLFRFLVFLILATGNVLLIVETKTFIKTVFLFILNSGIYLICIGTILYIIRAYVHRKQERDSH